jgi:hypothetical protein
VPVRCPPHARSRSRRRGGVLPQPHGFECFLDAHEGTRSDDAAVMKGGHRSKEFHQQGSHCASRAQPSAPLDNRVAARVDEVARSSLHSPHASCSAKDSWNPSAFRRRPSPVAYEDVIWVVESVTTDLFGGLLVAASHARPTISTFGCDIAPQYLPLARSRPGWPHLNEKRQGSQLAPGGTAALSTTFYTRAPTRASSTNCMRRPP